MGKVLVDRRYIVEIMEGNYIGFGKEGKCYFTEDDNQLVKIFHDHLSVDRRKVLFDDLNNDQIAFPNDLLIDKDTNILVGYTMYYLGGEKFVHGFRDDLNLEELKKAYLKIRLIMLNLKDIYMFDNCLENMLYDYKLKRINLIDTSRWYQKLDGHIESINEFNWQMMNSLLENIDWKHFRLNQDKQLYDLYITYKYLENVPSLFLEFLNELENKVSEYKGYKVKTISDLRI